jgi:predicted component of type VI protein secretion system
MPYRLRYLAHDLELAAGEFVVGRSTECQLSLDDPLVSRRHAVLRIRRDGVTVQDLGSRNGVLVNGVKIDGERELAAGDKISIGSQEMVLQNADEPQAAAAGHEEVYRRATQTLGAAYVVDLRAVIEGVTSASPTPMVDPPTADASRSLQSFQLLGGVADKALAMGRAEEAERILHALLLDILNRVRDGNVIEPSIAETAAKYAARLGGATTKGLWVDYVFELYKRLKTPLPAQIVDELYSVVRKVKNVDLTMLRSYLADLRASAATLGPTQRFLVQRIEGLERLVSLR